MATEESFDEAPRDEAGTGIARRRFLIGAAGVLGTATMLELVPAGPSSASTPTAGARRTEIERIRALLVANWVSRDHLDDGTTARVGWTLQSQAMTYARSLSANGSWSDVDYSATTSAANGTPWPPYLALDRMQAMAAAYANPRGDHHHDPALLDGVGRALDYWFSASPTSTNWWEVGIGIQLRMFRVGLMLKPALTPARLAAIEGTLRTTMSNTPGSNGTGENAVWYAQEIVANGLLRDDPSIVTTGRDAISLAIATNTGDGMQPDNSYHQHGQQLYIDGYGRDQFVDVSHWMWALAGTSFAFSPIDVSNHLAYVLEGTRWVIKGEYQFFGNITDPGPWYARNSQRVSEALDWLRIAVPDQAGLFRQLADTIGLRTTDTGSIGSKHFWNSDFFAHHRRSWAVDIKMVSSRTTGSETRWANPSKANYLWWMPFGSTFISQRGDEFTDLLPVWDWTKIPGVTNPTFLAGINDPGPYSESTSFVGGVDNGMYGAAVQDFAKSDTVAKKSWFCFDDEFVALGAGITSTDPHPVTTSVNQTTTRGPVVAAGIPIPLGTSRAVTGSWAHHDGIGYAFPAPTTMNVKNLTQTGSWNGIGAPQDTTTISKNVFGLWLDHGATPVGATYAYIVRPGVTQRQAASYAASLPVSVLSNTTSLQAVRHQELGIAELAFWAAGSVQVRRGLTVAVSQPCLVIVDESSGGEPALTVSNPARSYPVDVTVTRNGVPTTTKVTLPGGSLLGQSVPLGGASNDRAYRRPVLASSQQASDVSPHFLTDGNPHTRWASAHADHQWVRVDLQDLRLVSQVKLGWGTAHARAFSVDLSTDGHDWTTVHSTTKGAGGTSTITFRPAFARFVRLTLTKPGTGRGFSLWKLEATGPADLAVGATASASSSANSLPPANAVDGSLGTRWGSQYSDPQHITVDLGTAEPLSWVVLRWELASARSYTVDISPDGGTWTNVYSTTSGTGGVVTIPVSGSGRYVRVNGTTRNTSYGYSLWEIEAYT